MRFRDFVSIIVTSVTMSKYHTIKSAELKCWKNCNDSKTSGGETMRGNGSVSHGIRCEREDTVAKITHIG